jgi:hypothetical protein
VDFQLHTEPDGGTRATCPGVNLLFQCGGQIIELTRQPASIPFAITSAKNQLSNEESLPAMTSQAYNFQAASSIHTPLFFTEI